MRACFGIAFLSAALVHAQTPPPQAYPEGSVAVTGGDKWCAELRKTGLSCSELRQMGEVLYYKRASNGEVVPMTLR